MAKVNITVSKTLGEFVVSLKLECVDSSDALKASKDLLNLINGEEE